MLGIGDYFWRLIPANPILLRVVETGGKRLRDAFIRCAYLGILIVVVCFLLFQSAGNLAHAQLAELSKTSQSIFYWMSYVQLFLVSLLAPVFTAGAITQEKDSQTYDILLSTPLSNGQIVLGSLLSRLFFVLSLLISGIPVFAITQIFGGVAIKSIVMSFLIASATAFVTGALAMAIAVFKVGTQRTIFSFYLLIMLYLAIPMVMENMGFFQYRWGSDGGSGFTSHVSWLAGIHPFLALRVLFGEPAYRPPELGMVQHLGWPWSWYLSSPHTFYITFMFFLSFVLVTPSIIMLRRLAQSSYTLRSWLLQLVRLSSGDKSRKPRRVWTNPIAWREAKTKASANRAVMLRYGFMLAGLAVVITLITLSSTQKASDRTIGLEYRADESAVTILDHGEPVVYRIAPGATIQLNGEAVMPERLRPGLVVDFIGITAQAEKRTLNRIQLSHPRTVLSQTAARQLLLGAIMVELAVILLILTQSAASTVTREKEDGTLDLLLCTPITSRYYIWGKLYGLVSFVLPLVAVPVLSIVFFVAWDIISPAPWRAGAQRWTVYPEAILVLPATLVMVTAFGAILGMQMSLRCRKTVMAVMSSVAIVGGVCGTLWMCGTGAASSSNFHELGLIIGSFSPFTLMSLMVSPSDAAGSNWGTFDTQIAQSRLLVFFAGWAAAAVYAIIVWAMYKSMVRNFDMTIRKQAT